MIDTLIDKDDNFEVVRDKIATILVSEVASQMALAVTAGKDPALWDLHVYTERFNVIEQWVTDVSDKTPIVNIWFTSSDFDKSKSDVFQRQQGTATINIDCYAIGESESDGGTGQILGDEAAARNVQRAVRLVRNILMASEYRYLEMQGTVAGRWFQSIEELQPTLDGQGITPIIGARMTFDVELNEFSPQVTPETLEEVFVEFHRLEDGMLVLNSLYDYTT